MISEFLQEGNEGVIAGHFEQHGDGSFEASEGKRCEWLLKCEGDAVHIGENRSFRQTVAQTSRD